MLRRRLAALVLLIITLNVTSNAQEWNRYIPTKKNERTKVIQKTTKSDSVKKLIGPGIIATVTWVTEPTARAMVSDKVDEERLSQVEAEREYSKMRPDDLYYFYIRILSRDKSHKTADDLLNSKTIFLQRAEDRKVFVRVNKLTGKFEESQSYFDKYSYIVTFPRLDQNNQPIVKNLEDIIELSIPTHAGTLTLKYKIKDLVTRLEDL